MPKYKVNGKLYDIPEEKVEKFESKYPNATVEYHNEGTTYMIPLSKREQFELKYPNATLGVQAASVVAPVAEEKEDTVQDVAPRNEAPVQSMRDESGEVSPKEDEASEMSPEEVQKRIRQRAIFDATQQGVDESIREGESRVGRILEPMTAEGRDRRKVAEGQARMAGAETTLSGLTPSYPAEKAEGGSQGQESTDWIFDSLGINRDYKKPVAISPVPYGVEYVEGKPVTRWLMPDGSITTNYAEADQAESVARKGRLRSEFERRMRGNGYIPGITRHEEKQAIIDAIVTGYNIGAKEHEAIVDAMKANGLDPNNPEHAKWVVSEDQRSILRHRSEVAQQRLDELYKRKRAEESSRPASNRFTPGAGAISNVSPQVAGTSRTQLDKDIEAVTAEVLLAEKAIEDYDNNRKAAGKGWFGKAMQGLGDALTDINTYTFGVVDASMNSAVRDADITSDYGRRLIETAQLSQDLLLKAPNPGGWYSGGRFVGSMMFDPTLYLSGGIGGVARKSATKLIGKAMAKGVTTDVASRLVGQKLVGRLGTAAVASSANLATFEFLGDMRQQWIDGGWTDSAGEFHEGFSMGHALGRGGHGAMLGATMGVWGAGFGNVADKMVKGTPNVAGKVAIRAGQVPVSIVGEGTIFAMPDIINYHSMSDDEFDKMYAEKFGYAGESDEALRNAARDEARSQLSWDAWSESQAFIFGMKVAGKPLHAKKLITSVEQRITELKGADVREHRSFTERLSQMIDRSPLDVVMTREELNELRKGGYGELADLFAKSKKGSKAESEPADRAIDFQRMEAEEVGTRREFDGYDAMQELMRDGGISQSARAKAYFILTGRMLPMGTVTGYTKRKTAEGEVVVNSVTADGEVVTSRRFKSEKSAEGEVAKIKRQAELNSIDVGEKFANEALNLVMMGEVKGLVAQRYKLPEEAIEDIYTRQLFGERISEAEKQIVDDINSFIEQGQGSERYKSLTPEAMRDRIEEGTGVNVDEALRKSEADRSESENGAIKEYAKSLYEQAERVRRANNIYNEQSAEMRDEAWQMQRGDRLIEDGRAAEIKESVANRTHKDSGVIIPATMMVGDRPVYIIKGDVVMFADGSGVDVGKSSESVVIVDAQTGEKEFVSPDQIYKLSDALNPQEVLTAEMDAYERMMRAERDSGIDDNSYNTDETDNAEGGDVLSTGEGVEGQRRDYEPGDKIVMEDSSGNIIYGEIVDYDAADDRYVVDVDSPIRGGYSPQMSREELDGMVVGHNGESVEKKMSMPAEKVETEVGDNGNELVNLQREGENDGISERISQRDDATQAGEAGEISRVLAVINSARASSDSGAGGSLGEGTSSRGGTSVSGQEIEQRAVEAYAKDSGLWVPMSNVFDLGHVGPSGNENETYIAEDGGSIFKVNNLMNSRGEISRLLDKIVLHNRYFPETAYELMGFTGFDGRSVYPILRQPLVKDATNATPEEIDEYMRSLGFEQTGEAAYSNGAVTISDLRPRNVLKDSDGDIYVVDAELKRVDKTYNSDEADKRDNTTGDGLVVAPQERVENEPQSALSRIPIDEKSGEPMYESVEAEMAWDAILEQTDGDEAMAQSVVAGMVADKEAALKKLEKAKSKGGVTIAEKIASEKERKAAIESARQELEAWKRIADTYNRRKAEAAERRREQEAERREAEQAVLHDEAVARFEEEQRVKAQKQAEQDAIGSHAVNPKIKEKWDVAEKVEGYSDIITLPDGSPLRGKYVLYEAGSTSASHDPNSGYVPTEGFPIDENGQSVNDRDYHRDKEAQSIVENMADAYDSRALQNPVVVSQDGIVLSGNNRTMSGDLAARRGTDTAYIDYLKEFGGKYGFTAGEIEVMQHPRVAFVPDEPLPYNAATFARFNAQEMKSQSKPETAVKLGKIVPEEVFNGIVGDISRYDNMGDFYRDDKATARALGGLLQSGVINNKQLPELRTGTALSSAGKELIENTLIGKVFQSNPDAVRQLIGMPGVRQSVVMALSEIASNRMLSSGGYDLGAELAGAIDLVSKAKAAMPDVFTEGVPVSPFGRQKGLFDDEFGESSVTDATILLLSDILNSNKPGDLRKVLAMYNQEAQQAASGQMDIFSGEVESKETILKRVNEYFNNATTNEKQAIVESAIADRKNRAEQQSRGGGTQGEQIANVAERGEERQDRGEGLRLADDGRHVAGQSDLAQAEVTAPLSEEVNEFDKPFILSSSGTTTFGEVGMESGLTAAPIKLSLGENVKDENGANHGYGWLHIEAGHGEQIRAAGFASVEEFVETVARNYDTIREGGVIADNQTYLLEISDEHNNTLFIQLSRDGNYWNVNSAGIFKKKYSRRKQEVFTRPAFEPDTNTNTSGVDSGKTKGVTTPAGNSPQTSDSKYIEKSRNSKELGEKSDVSSVQEQIQAAEVDVNTNPTEAQKEAGNYKKGHVHVGAFNITIEQPKGSVRRGVDANGKEWETTMQNTYGYIRGTEGVDGDHIDVFLSDDIDGWNGRKVYVVDQYNEDGSFDEHKVMLGFNDIDEADTAYLSNYEKGWANKRKIVIRPANVEDFEKWIGSSHRKTKPFAEYKSVQVAEKRAADKSDNVSDKGITGSGGIGEIKPIGRGAFGNIYDQFKGNAKEAIAFLLQKKDGEATGALHHKDIGDIDLVWGEEGTGKSDGYGLAKLVKYHPEVLDNLQEILDDMHVVQRSANRVQLESDMHQAAVRLTWDNQKKNWLLTAFEKKNSALDNTTDTGKTLTGKRNDTATPQSTVVSDSKDTTIPNTNNKSGHKFNKGERFVLSSGATITIQDVNEKGERIFTWKSINNDNLHTSKATVEELEIMGAKPLEKAEKGAEDKSDKWDEADKVEGVVRAGNNAQRNNKKAKRTDRRSRRLGDLSDNEFESGIASGHELVRVEPKTKKGTIFDFVTKDKERPVLQGVHHEGGYAIATDAFVMVGRKDKYDATLEGKTINKKGEMLTYEADGVVKDMEYPNWRMVLPQTTEPTGIDIYDLSSVIEGIRVADGVKRVDELDSRIAIKTDDGKIISVGQGHLALFLRGAKQVGATEIGVRINNYVTLYAEGDNGFAVVHGVKGVSERANSFYDAYTKEAVTTIGGREFNIADEAMESERGSEAFARATEATMQALEATGVEVVMATEEMVAEMMGDTQVEKQAVQAANERFNRELHQQIDGSLPQGHIYRFGMPSAVLQSAGLPYLPIELAASRLTDKSMQENHPFELSEVENLVESVQNPLAVFRSATHIGSYVVLTEIQHGGKNYVVAIETHRKQGKIEINSVRSVHYRNSNNHIANWIEEGLLEYVDKKRMSEWLSKQQYNSADVRKLFRHSAKIVESFENPKVSAEFSRMSAPFYSNARKSVLEIKQEKGTPEQWIAMLKKNGGLKAGEDSWVGLEKWLNERKGMVTKQEVVDYLNEKSIQIEEEEYGDPILTPSELVDFELGIKESLSKGRTIAEAIDWWDVMTGDNMGYFYETGKIKISESGDVAVEGGALWRINRTRLEYTTRGLEGKREIVLTVPTIEPYNTSDEIHFGEAGSGRAVAWVRFGETEDSDGNRVLVIDEIQSKRHQDGREKGYKSVEAEKRAEDAMKAVREATIAYRQYNVQLKEKYGDPMSVRGAAEERKAARRKWNERLSNEERAKFEELLQRKNEAATEYERISLSNRHKVPEAPFEKNWHELAMKRMLRYAAENGYDKVAWTTGAQQAERYDISLLVEGISVEDSYLEEFSDGTPVAARITISTTSGNIFTDIDAEGVIHGGEYSGRGLEDAVGKELANSIKKDIQEAKQRKEAAIKAQSSLLSKMKETAEDSAEYEELLAKYAWQDRIAAQSMAKRRYSGGDLRIGGEGMKGFYDKMLPSFVSKYVKKWGAKVGEVTLPGVEESGRVMHAVDVTAEMRESVMQGQPMFLRRSDGKIYGWSLNGKIYLTAEGINPETPVHEYTHLWVNALERSNPKEWKEIVAGLKGSKTWGEVMRDEHYRDIWHDESRVASEVLSRLSGRENYRREMARAEQEIKEATGAFEVAEKVSVWESVKRALRRFVDYVKRLLTGKAKGKSEVLNGQDVPWVDFVERPLRDFWGGVNPKVNRSPIEKMFVGERGAKNLDDAQEATTRYDNLAIAREMERKLSEKKQRVEKLKESESIELTEDASEEAVMYRDGEMIKDRIEELFNQAISGEFKGKPVAIGRLTEAGKGYLEQISGVSFKDKVNFVLNPSDLVHIYKDHFGNNEKDKGQNIPLDIEDIRSIVDVVSSPNKVIFFKEGDGLKRNMFYFFKEAEQGTYNLMEIYSDKKGNLTAKTFYKTRKDASQRVMDIDKSLLPTSETYFGAILSDANIPQMFENPSVGDDYSVAEGSVAMKEDRVAELSEALNTSIRVISGEGEVAELPSRRRRSAKGWYDRERDEVVVVLPNNVDVADVENTVVHEVVGHKGLRELIGEERFGGFVDEVYEHATEGIRRVVDGRVQRMVDAEADRIRVAMTESRERAGEDANAYYYADMAEARVKAEEKRGQYRREATEEYMADMAGKIGEAGFEKMSREEQTLWGRIKAKVQKFLDAFLRGLKISKRIKLGDKDIAYILFKSWKHKRGGGVFAEAEEVVMREGTSWDGKNESRLTVRGISLDRKKATVNGRKYISTTRSGHKQIFNSVYKYATEKLGAENVDYERAKSGSIYMTIDLPNGHDVEIRFASHTPSGYSIGEIENRAQEKGLEWSAIHGHVGAKVDISLNTMTSGDLRAFIDLMYEHAENGFPQEVVEKLQSYSARANEVSEALGISVEDFGSEREGRFDNQGNPIDENGKLIVDEVSSIDNITDADFETPSRSIQLPSIPRKVDEAIGANGKPVVIKKNVFEKNKKSHKDLTPKGSREILKNALYSTDLYGQNQKITRPYNWILIHLAETNTAVLVEINENKDNVEVVNWHYLRGESLEQKKRQAIKEGGLILTLKSAAGDALNDLSSANKDNNNHSEKQEEEGVIYRDGDPEAHEREIARWRYEERVKRGWYQTKEALQDSMLGLKEAMLAIAQGKSGKKVYIEDIAGFENAYLGENRLSSVNQAEADAMARLLFKPMLEEMSRLAKGKKRRAKLKDYMMAKHGLERNAYMREQARVNDEETERDFAGLTALTGIYDYEAAELEAQRMVEEYEKSHDTTELWKRVNAVSDAILSKSYECGLMSKETYDKVSGMYDYYIPLRGFDEKTSGDAYAYLMHKGSAFNVPIKKAKGRSSKADDPIVYLQSMAENVIMQGNRNKLVKQRFLNFVLNHPSDLASVSDLWIRYDSVKDEWEPVFPDNIDVEDTAEEVERKMQLFEEKMSSLSEQYPDEYKRGKDAVGIPYRVVDSREGRQHQIVVKRNGRDYVITINGNPRAAQAVNGLTNPDNNIGGAIGAILQLGTWTNRQLSKVYTTRNPDFVVSNFIRDMVYSNSMMWVRESPNYALRYHMNYARVNPVVMRKLLYKYNRGTLDMSDKTESMFYHFMMNGGETGYVNVRDIEKHRTDIERELRKHKRRIPVGTALSLLGKQIDNLNRSVENCARFAAFVTSREMGRSVDRSIYDAKEVSVNFNKKGSGDRFYKSTGQTQLGSTASALSGGGRALYVFWNAAIQGTTNFGRQVKRHPIKGLMGMASMYLLGALVASLGADDDDENTGYYNLPEYVRRSNIVFKAGDSWISIPLPIEYRALYGMGELMVSTLSGKERKSDVELAEAILGQVSQVLPLDFMEGGGGMNAFVPSGVKPLWEAYIAEKSWTGLPLYKDTPYNEHMPEWTKAYSSSNKHIVGLTAALNEASGGDKYTKGSIDINPAKVEYMLNGYLGGYFNIANRLVKTVETVSGEREFDPQNVLTLSLRHPNQRFSQSSVSMRYAMAFSSSVRQRVFVTVSLFSGRAISMVTTVSAILNTSSTEYGHPDSFSSLSSSLYTFSATKHMQT